MKNLNYLGIILFVCVLALNSSCKKNAPGDGIGLNDDCFASWKVDGISYDSDDMAGCLYLDGTLHLSTTLTGGDFFLQIDPITTTGTYSVDINNPDLDVIVLLLKLSDGTQLGINNGNIVVTALSNSKAKGTFSGNFYDFQDINLAPVFSVTNGVFEANF